MEGIGRSSWKCLPALAMLPVSLPMAWRGLQPCMHACMLRIRERLLHALATP